MTHSDTRTFEQVAPRLYKAHRQELAYRQHRREALRRGVISMTVACEEMVRSMRRMARQATTAAEAMRAFMEAWKR